MSDNVNQTAFRNPTRDIQSQLLRSCNTCVTMTCAMCPLLQATCRRPAHPAAVSMEPFHTCILNNKQSHNPPAFRNCRSYPAQPSHSGDTDLFGDADVRLCLLLPMSSLRPRSTHEVVMTTTASCPPVESPQKVLDFVSSTFEQDVQRVDTRVSVRAGMGLGDWPNRGRWRCRGLASGRRFDTRLARGEADACRWLALDGRSAAALHPGTARHTGRDVDAWESRLRLSGTSTGRVGRIGVEPCCSSWAGANGLGAGTRCSTSCRRQQWWAESCLCADNRGWFDCVNRDGAPIGECRRHRLCFRR